MSRIKCKRCQTVLAEQRGAARVRFTPGFRVVTVREVANGAQVLEGVCPGCRNDVAIPMPLTLARQKVPTVEDLRQSAGEIA